MKRVGGDGESFEREGGLLEVDLDESDEGVGNRGEGIMSGDIVGVRLHDGCIEGKDGLFAEGCDHGVSEFGEM